MPHQLYDELDVSLELYDDILIHYGSFLGTRHARKHLGWALDHAASAAGAPIEALKRHRARILTADRPQDVRHRLAEAFDAFAAIQASRRFEAPAGRVAA
jgi:hypothetical protein